MNTQTGIPKKRRYVSKYVVEVEEEEKQKPLFYRDVKPTQHTGPNIFGKTVTCWGLTGIDRNTGIQAFVRLDNPEQAEEFYETK